MTSRRSRLVEAVLILFVVVTGVTLLAPKGSVAGAIGDRVHTWMGIAMTLIAAVVNGMVWARRDHFWLPRYVHVLAALGLVASGFGAWVGRESWSTAPLITIGRVLLGPAVVYVVFLAYDGVTEARKGAARPS